MPDQGTLLDLGCGQGLLLALLREARPGLSLHGIDAHARRVGIARRALGADAFIEQRDLRQAVFPRCSAIAALDVLYYLERKDADQVIRKAADALEPAGVLLIREPDSAAGVTFQLTRLSAWFDAAVRGNAGGSRNYRSAAEWRAQLEGLGLRVDAEPMSQGTPFANVLFAAHKP